MDLVQGTYSFGDNAYRRFVERIKDAVDPNGILAPGKQGIWPASHRQQRLTQRRRRSYTCPSSSGSSTTSRRRDGKPVEQIYEERIASLKRAEEGGFHAFHLAEHHGHSLSTAPTASVFLAALARETTHDEADPDRGLPAAAQPGAALRGPGDGRRAVRTAGSRSASARASRRSSTCSSGSTRRRRPPARKRDPDDAAAGVGDRDHVQRGVDVLRLPRAASSPSSCKQKPYPPLWTAGNVETAGRGGHNFVYPYTMSRPRSALATTSCARRAGWQPGHAEPARQRAVGRPVPGRRSSRTPTRRRERSAAGASGRTTRRSSMRAHGLIPPHLQEAVPDVMDNPVAKAQLIQDPIEVGLSVCGTVETVRDYYVEQARRGLANYFIAHAALRDMMTDEQTETGSSAFIDRDHPGGARGRDVARARLTSRTPHRPRKSHATQQHRSSTPRAARPRSSRRVRAIRSSSSTAGGSSRGTTSSSRSPTATTSTSL